MKNILVAGGGIAGMLAALLLARQKYTVVLIEKENALGGLLKSTEHEGAYYDHGTHLLRQTGNKELDEILYGPINETSYCVLPILKTGTFFNGQLYTKNGFIQAATLPETIYQKGLQELLTASPAAQAYTNLEEKLVRIYGETFAEEIFAKAMRKLTSVQDISLLDTNALNLFGLGRIIVEDAQKTTEWKKDPVLDAKIAFHSFEEGVSSLLSFYPKEKGVGAWITYLQNKLKEAGVNIVTGQFITSLKTEGDQVKGVITNTAEAFSCDQLVWTLPAFNLLDLTKHEALKTLERPMWQFSHIFHYETEQPYINDIYYYHNYDPAYKSFRVTLYKNYNGASRNTFTVEVLSSDKLDPAVFLPKIFDEVKQQIYENPDEVNCVYGSVSSVSSGFPVPTLRFSEANKGLNKIAAEQFSNVALLGKASGNSFFMIDVLKETYAYCEKFNVTNV